MKHDYVQGGIVVVDGNAAYGIAAFSGAENAIIDYCEENGLELSCIQLVCGWDEAEAELEAVL